MTHTGVSTGAFSARHIRLTGFAAVAAIAVIVSAACGGSSANPVSPTSSSSTTATTADSLVSTGALAYDPDLKAIFQSDCVRCHGSSGASAGYSMTSYAGVMAAVRAGNAQSLLITTTQPSGSMYSHLSGNRAGRADMIRNWVVTHSAAATR
jgi:cytochrome c553